MLLRCITTHRLYLWPRRSRIRLPSISS